MCWWLLQLSLIPAKFRPELSCSKENLRVDSFFSSQSVLGTAVVNMPSAYKLLPVYGQPLQSAAASSSANVDAGRDQVRQRLVLQCLKFAFRRFREALASEAHLRVQLAASLHMGQIHCCRVACEWRYSCGVLFLWKFFVSKWLGVLQSFSVLPL